jgi:hypothetical protein
VTPLERRVRALVYRWLLATSRAPDLPTLAAALNAPATDVSAALHQLAAAHTLVLAPGTTDVWMAHPFSAIPTAFPVVRGERTYYANCAWDAAGVLSIVGNGRCTTLCADCDAELAFEVVDDAIAGAGVVHFAVPARRFWDDIGFT